MWASGSFTARRGCTPGVRAVACAAHADGGGALVQVAWVVFVGLGFLMLFSPLNVVVMQKLYSYYHGKTAGASCGGARARAGCARRVGASETDKRLKLMNELLLNIRTVKFFGARSAGGGGGAIVPALARGGNCALRASQAGRSRLRTRSWKFVASS